MDVYLYKLKFKGPVHFGDTGIDLENVKEYVNSDTLFSAIINAVNIYFGSEEAGKLIQKFLQKPPFLLSSLFIFNKDLYFLPKPMDDSFISEEIKRTKGKELKKLKWLEKNDFIKWQRQDILNVEDIEMMQKKQSDYGEAFTKEIRPRVSLDRITQQSSIYHCGYIYFNQKAGLYGLVAFYDTNFIEKFKNILILLGQTGLGGEKTYGCGMFDVVFEQADSIFQEILKTKTDNYTLLSLYHPAPEELTTFPNNLIAYDIIRKKGWVTSGRNSLPLKRKSVGFITEGSVLKKNLKGCLVDVTPESIPDDILSHRVYRYGYAFTAPLWEA
ncbi:type III-A CRISPR-associated RAMP protein Csm4 [Thermodesulfovibrio sp.]|uniref:type III-A CRISPR-associated RAMP protein Csm4 n=1 Tax=Thermodesulfovibrio sp. TaxID=2067987 RepID=UPI0030B65217